MRHTGVLSVVAAIGIVAVAGCGTGSGIAGGAGNNGASGSGSNTPINATTKNVTGIWTGSATQTRGVGDVSSLQMQVAQNGAAFTGTVISTQGGVPDYETITGSVSGSQVTANVTAPSGTNSTSITASVSGSTLSGTWSSGSGSNSSGGNFSLTKSATTSTANVAGTWSGTSLDTGSTSKPLSVTFTQSGTNLTVTGTSDGSITGIGAIIGNTLSLTVTSGTNTSYVTGTVSGNTITGTAQDNSGSAPSTFTVSKTA